VSEAIAGIPAAPPPARARDAAAVIMFRRATSGLQIFWLRRGARLSFAAGFYAFPGGALDPDDASVPVEGAEGLDAALRAAAVRELFEETGVLCAEGAEKLSDAELSRLRAGVLAGTASFGTCLRAQNLGLSRKHLLEAGRWITPAFMSSRFDARFFLLELPPGQLPQFWPGEHAEGGWVSPSDALRQWEEGTTLLHPPTLHALRILGAFTRVEEIAERLRDPPNCSDYIPERIEFQRGIRMFPLRTPTLPPATHTNCYLLGDGELLIVDPGASDPGECDRLFAFLGRLAAEGMKPKAVFLTHHHSDHVGGVAAVKKQLGLPIWCHELTASRLTERADRLIAEGEWVVLAGEVPMRFSALHTPGHARGHLCLVEERSKAAIVGDMVAGLGTIVIDPPEGDMSDYLDQLRRLRALPVGALYPSHGPAIADGPAKLTEYVEHRALREERVLNAVLEGQSTIAQIVAAAYTDVGEFVHPIAARSTEAILIKLIREGKVNREEDRYFAAR
jgi:glyoxylase-like metal-dependent hydrolase (beta-lactamase superfamily II)/8-oxo-dGTP pyrophosphatase MutT (NUDIX family)